MAAFAWFAAGFVTCLALVGCALIRDTRRSSVEQQAMSNPYTEARGRVEDV